MATDYTEAKPKHVLQGPCIMIATQGFTSADLECLPDIPGVRYEIIDGELLVSRAPGAYHEFVVIHLGHAFIQCDPQSQRGVVLPSPGLVLADDADVIPDLVWVSRARLRTILDEKGHLTSAPELAVEVLSPGRVNEVRDRELKLSLYARQGVQEYWIVDWQQRSIDIFRRRGTGLVFVESIRGDEALTSPLLPGFTCQVSTLWLDDSLR